MVIQWSRCHGDSSTQCKRVAEEVENEGKLIEFTFRYSNKNTVNELGMGRSFSSNESELLLRFYLQDKRVVMKKKKEWTEKQKELWEVEKKYWDHFTVEDMDEFMNLWHDDFKGWPFFAKAPLTKRKLKKSFEMMQSMHTSEVNTELTPHEINLFGEDTGIVIYQYTSTSENSDGEPTETSGRVTHIWRKSEAGAWQIIGAMSAPLK